jgi:uncharacterized membrane protein
MHFQITLLRFAVSLASGAMLAVLARPAYAEFRVCNQSLNLFNFAVGRPVDGVFKIEGWWTVPANICVTAIKEDLQNRFIYLHALSVTGEDLLKGDRDMCVKPEKFTYIHDGGKTWDCWAKGYQQVKFAEIDTGERATSWTVFIKPPAGGP